MNRPRRTTIIRELRAMLRFCSVAAIDGPPGGSNLVVGYVGRNWLFRVREDGDGPGAWETFRDSWNGQVDEVASAGDIWATMARVIDAEARPVAKVAAGTRPPGAT